MKKYERETIPPSASLTPPFTQGRSGVRSEMPEDREIMSAQVLFPDRKTADEVVKELWEKVDSLQAEVDALKENVEGTE